MLIEAAWSSRKLAQAGKPATVVAAALARELPGFVWAIAQPATPTRPWR